MKYRIAVCALTVVALLVACRNDVAGPPTTGSIALEIVTSVNPAGAATVGGRGASSSSGIATSLAGPLDHLASVRVQVSGPTNRTQTLTKTDTSFSGTVGGLLPGSYTVVLEGLVSNQVDHFGQRSGITVVAGQNNAATITFASFRPVLNSLSSAGASGFDVGWSSVAGASGYVLEWSTNRAFTSAESQSVTGTSANVSVSGSGWYHVRVTAQNSNVSAGRPSEPDSIEVISAPTASLSINDVTLDEGNAGTTSFDFTVTLSSASSNTVTVLANTVDGSATVADGDYDAVVNQVVTFAPGVVSQVVSVAVNGDGDEESDETFTVALSGATGATIADAQGVGTITDDDIVITILSISIDDVTLAEGDAGITSFDFTVTLSVASSNTVTVLASTADGSATVADGDYLAVVNQVVTFAPGVTSQVVSVSVNGDVVAEPTETFTVELSGASEGTISDGQGVGTITDDDGGQQGIELVNRVPVTGLQGAEFDRLEFYVDVPAGQSDFGVVLFGGTGDADLLVEFPNSQTEFCDSAFDGNNEVCSFANPSAGRWNVVVEGFTAFDGVTLAAVYVDGAVELLNGVPVSGIQGAQNAELRYYIDVPDGQTQLDVAISGGSGDADLYVAFGIPPTTQIYACRPFLGGNNEQCSSSNPIGGRWQIMIHGATTFDGVTLVATHQ